MLFGLFVLLVGGGMLVIGVIPIGKFPLAVRSVSIQNIWVRIAGVCLLAGYIILRSTGIEYNWVGVGLYMLTPLFIAAAIIKHITDAGVK